MDSELEDRYFLDYIIGCGTYSKVYSGHDKANKNDIAVKFEMLTSFDDADNSYLKREYDVYSKLTGKDSIGVADIKMFGCDEGKVGEKGPRNYLVMELLGLDLEKLLQQCSGKFSLKTVLLLADQMISIIQYIHSIGYIHGDVKPANFLLGRKEKDSMLYMVDFWLAKEYIDPLTKNHISYNETARCQGINRFTSINCHKGIGQSRRDDLESLGYVFLYLLRGNLPWPGDEKEQEKRLVYEKKVSISLKELCFGQPSEFETYLEYCRSLKFDEEPDYAYLKKIFKELFHRSWFTEDNEYDWKITGTQSVSETVSKDEPMGLSSTEEKQESRSVPLQFYGPESKTSENKLFLDEYINSSDVKPETAFFMFNADYIPMAPYIKPESTEECLEEILKFASNPIDQKNNSEGVFKWFGESALEIKERYLETITQLECINKWDLLDWKTSSDEDIAKTKKLISTFLAGSMGENSICEEACGDFIKATYDIYHDYIEYKNQKQDEDEELDARVANKKGKSNQRMKTNWICGQKSETVKHFIEKLAILAGQMTYMRNGLCKYELPVLLSKDAIKQSKVESLRVKIAVQPDGIFTKPILSSSCFEALWSIVVEVYGPYNTTILNKQDDETNFPYSSSENMTFSPESASHDTPASVYTDSDEESSSSSNASMTGHNKLLLGPLSKPIMKKDSILDAGFVKNVKRYIERSVHCSCHRKNNLQAFKKLTGQHVVQLFTHVFQNFRMHKLNEKYMTLWNGRHGYIMEGTEIHKAIGIYMVNEYVYFSRLDVTNLTLESITGHDWLKKNRFVKQHAPQISYSNFRLDITKKNHRLALLMFCRAYNENKVPRETLPSLE